MGKLILSTRDGYEEERKFFFLRFLKFKADKLKVFPASGMGGNVMESGNF